MTLPKVPRQPRWKVSWWGGPLDGCVDEIESPLIDLWVGPDPTEPNTRIIAYMLERGEDGLTYRYSEEQTKRINSV